MVLAAADIAEICGSCGSAHMGPKPCGLSFSERLRSVRLDPSATPTKTMSMWDREAIRNQLGDHVHEQMMEETHGIGPIGPDGTKLLNGEKATMAETAFMVGEGRDSG